MYCAHLCSLERAKARQRGGVGRFDKRHTKKHFFRASFFFAKPGLSEFHKSSAQKKQFLEPDIFLQSRACLSFTRAVRKKAIF